MMNKSMISASLLLLCTQPLLAAGQYTDPGTVQNSVVSENGYNAGSRVVVDMPPQAWTQGQSNTSQPPCQRCCTYENRSYTEGAVVKMEGVLLQCVRDEHSYGTNNLVWKLLKQ
ncbi:YnjH family protein [Erwinia tracheiphila]|uniref:DUF1496 domain-containing protein n=1 Tax=Erwinia tracheiphila TaxID=65700 RepID=A0A345CQK7_9GAMM|nr:DUF1496 domain-containing protein [Erwinia tracheiphila]AXF75724.1 DUF1496 domain-containing protein [Erwinia tracheiphila]UIA81728.1 YnjH family protein [Erwinia tracheiphila]UIA90323.1 YnjH family protein [Erwinia tracheiphila]